MIHKNRQADWIEDLNNKPNNIRVNRNARQVSLVSIYDNRFIYFKTRIKIKLRNERPRNRQGFETIYSLIQIKKSFILWTLMLQDIRSNPLVRVIGRRKRVVWQDKLTDRVSFFQQVLVDTLNLLCISKEIYLYMIFYLHQAETIHYNSLSTLSN